MAPQIAPKAQVVRVGCMARISTDEKNQPYSIDAQTTAMEAFVASQPGHRITHRFVDHASGATLARPGLQQALDAARSGEFDVLLVYRIDRLARSIRGLMDIVEDLEKAGVALRSVTEPIDTSGPVGRMLLQLLGIFAEFERAILIDRITGGLGRKAARGEWSGRPPFGYTVDKDTKTLRPNDAAALVPVIFDTYVAGQLGATAIAHWLNQTGQRSVADNLWDGRSVIRVLRNPAYVGKVRHDDTEYEGRHEPLIDQAVFDAAQKLLDERGGDIDRHPKSAYVLGGLTRCRNCQRAFIGQSAYGKSKRVYRYYVCSTQATKGKRACAAQRVSADALEKAVIASLVDTYSDVDLFQEAIRAAAEATTDTAAAARVEAELASADKRIKDTTAALDRYLRAFEDGSMPPAVCAPRLEELAAERDELKAYRDELDAQNRAAVARLTVPTTDRLRETATTLERELRKPPERVKATLAALIDRVEISPDRHAQPWFKVPADEPASAHERAGRKGVRMNCQRVEKACAYSNPAELHRSEDSMAMPRARTR